LKAKMGIAVAPHVVVAVASLLLVVVVAETTHLARMSAANVIMTGVTGTAKTVIEIVTVREVLMAIAR
jgi:hypothetical protein